MLNVLHLINYAGKGGTEKYVYNLIDHMHGNSVNAYLAYNINGPLIDNVESLGVSTYKICMSNPFDIKAALKLAKLCRSLHIDIIHTHYLRENYIALISKCFNPKIKVVYTNHIINHDSCGIIMFNRLFTRLQDKIIAISNNAKEILIKNGHDAKKIELIHHGVPLAEDCRVTAGSNDVFTIFCGSRFTKEKGHFFLIRSLIELRKKAPIPFKCMLANDGPLLEECKKLVFESGLGDIVSFIGFVKDINSVYKTIDLYVNPSKEEALGLANLEILALGIPLIATDVGGVRDIINDRTKCGVLVKYDDCEGMADAIIKVMNDKTLRDTISRNAVNTVKSTFSMEGMIEKTNNIYKGMM